MYLRFSFRWMDVLTKASMTDDQQAATIVATKQSLGVYQDNYLYVYQYYIYSSLL